MFILNKRSPKTFFLNRYPGRVIDQLQYINLDFNRGVSSEIKHRFSYRSVFLSCGMELFYGFHSQLNIFLTLDRFP